MTQDMKLSYLPYITNSYHLSGNVPIDKFLKKAIKTFNEKGYETEFCCSGHTDEKNLETLDCEKSTPENPVWKKYTPHVYIIFRKNYNFSKQQVFMGRSRIQFNHCGTLMGIKKACRKMYILAQSL